MSTPESVPLPAAVASPEASAKSSRSKPPTPNLVSVAGWVLLAISAGWVALLVYTTVSLTTTHLPRLSTWHSSTLVEAQAYYTVLFLML